MKTTYYLTDNARIHAIIMRLEKNEQVPCGHRFLDRKIELDTEDYHDMKIIRFLNTINVVKFIDVDWSDEK